MNNEKELKVLEQYEWLMDHMAKADPCENCSKKSYCRDTNAICRAFDEYVSSGRFDPFHRSKPVTDGYKAMLKNEGHWRNRIGLH